MKIRFVIVLGLLLVAPACSTVTGTEPCTKWEAVEQEHHVWVLTCVERGGEVTP